MTRDVWTHGGLIRWHQKKPLGKIGLYRKKAIIDTTHATYHLTTEEERLTHMMKALGHPARMQIVRYLSETPGCITGDIVHALPLAQATVSQHLKVLRDAGWICGTIEGPATCYCLHCDKIAWFKAQVGQIF
jgi:ArsR family transcriptional regulator, arsenate/arsenite/antimonite-responsive transcriptional repressor